MTGLKKKKRLWEIEGLQITAGRWAKDVIFPCFCLFNRCLINWLYRLHFAAVTHEEHCSHRLQWNIYLSLFLYLHCTPSCSLLSLYKSNLASHARQAAARWQTASVKLINIREKNITIFQKQMTESPFGMCDCPALVGHSSLSQFTFKLNAVLQQTHKSDVETFDQVMVEWAKNDTLWRCVGHSCQTGLKTIVAVWRAHLSSLWNLCIDIM